MNTPTVLVELNNLLPSNKDISSGEWAKYDCAKVIKENGYDVLRTIDVFGGFTTAMGRAFAYRLIFNIVSDYAPNIEFSTYYQDQFSFYIDALPSYIGGDEVDDFVDALDLDLPQEASKSKKMKLFKETLKKHFICKNERKPYWIQNPEWPADESGIPLVFVSQKSIGDLCQFTFENPDTGRLRVVEQYY